jgi:HK97 family phage major capsid protein
VFELAADERIKARMRQLIRKNESMLKEARASDRILTPAEHEKFERNMTELRELELDLHGLPVQDIGDLAKAALPSAPPSEGRDYRSLFLSSGSPLPDGGYESFEEFAEAVRFGRIDERMQRSLQEGVPSDGGFAVPAQFAAYIFNVSLEQEVVRPRANIHPMSSEKKHIPGTVIGDCLFR